MNANLRERWSGTNALFRNAAFRRYYVAQVVSQIGSWLQFLGLIWLVIRVVAPDDALALGMTTAFEVAPTVLMLFGGAIADGVNRRNLLVATQSVQAVLAVLLGVAIVTNVASLPLIYAYALVIGIVTAIDSPARSGFVTELAAGDQLVTAVALNSAAFQGTRAVGVALAPVLIATFGVSAPFFANGLSFSLVSIALLMTRPSELIPAVPPATGKSRVLEGLRTVAGSRIFVGPLVMLAFVSLFTLSFGVTFPLYALKVLNGGIALTSWLFVASSAGAVASAIFLALTRPRTQAALYFSGLLFGVALLLLAVCTNVPLALCCAAALGAGIAATTTNVSIVLQTQAPRDMKSRVMSVYTMVLTGGTFVGVPLVSALISRHVITVPGAFLLGASAVFAGTASAIAIAKIRVPGRLRAVESAGDASERVSS